MAKWAFTFLFFLCVIRVHSQRITLPGDFRQHNLTEYNSSLFHPVLAFYGNDPHSLAFWSRWQWQGVDADPTTLLVNYTHRLNGQSAAGLGFFQHNTGLFINTGAVLNYAYVHEVSETLKIGIGVNLFGFKQLLADDRSVIDPQIQLPQLRTTDDVIVQAAPGIFVNLKDLGLGFASENLFDYNFTLNERQSGPEERIYLFSAAYDFHPFSKKTVLRPTVYWKSLPFADDQLGLNTLFSGDKFWLQAGYNSFYGVSVGGGGRFFNSISLGALVEFATDSDLNGTEPTFEFVAAYRFGKQLAREEPVRQEGIVEEGQKPEDGHETQTKAEAKESKTEETVTDKGDEGTLEDTDLQQGEPELDGMGEATEPALEREQATKRRLDSIQQAEIAAMAERAVQRRNDSLGRVKVTLQQEREQRQLDSLAKRDAERVRRSQNALAAQRRLDSMNRLKTQQVPIKTEEAHEPVVLEKNEKYEEVTTEDGLQPGFYLIANVFGTKKYYEAFMRDLTQKGLQPKSFLRSLNNYQYVYLDRYDTMAEARKARDSKFFGNYSDAIWIFRVVGE